MPDGAELTRRSVLTGGASLILVQAAGPGFADDGFRPREEAQRIYTDVAFDQWRAEVLASQDPGAVQQGLINIVNQDRSRSIGALRQSPSMLGAAEAVDEQISEREQRVLDSARDHVEFILENIERDIATEAANRGVADGNAPTDVPLNERDRLALDEMRARLIEGDPSTADDARATLIERFGGEALADPAYAEMIDEEAERLSRQSSEVIFERKVGVIEEYYGQSLDEIPLNDELQATLDGRMRIFDRDAETIDMPISREDYMEQYRYTLLARPEEVQQAIIDEFRPDAEQSYGLIAQEHVALQIARRPENLQERLRLYDEAGLELSEAGEAEIQQRRSELGSNSPEGREAMADINREDVIAEGLTDERVRITQLDLTRYERFGDDMRARVLGALDDRLTEEYGEETAERFMAQIDPNNERSDLDLSSDAVTPEVNREAIIEQGMDGIVHPTYREAIEDYLDGSISREAVETRIGEQYAEFSRGLNDVRGWGSGETFEERLDQGIQDLEDREVDRHEQFCKANPGVCPPSSP